MERLTRIQKRETKSMKKDVIEKLKEVEKEIENGEGIEIDVAFEELRQKYGY